MPPPWDYDVEATGSGIAPPAPGVPVASSFIVPRVVHLAPAALPALGVYTAQANTVVPLGTKRVTYWITYTRDPAGADTGFPTFIAEEFNGTEQSRVSVLDASSLVPSQPDGEVNFYQEELLGPMPVTDAAILYELVYELGDAVTGVRLLAAERGDTANPGTLGIALTGSG